MLFRSGGHWIVVAFFNELDGDFYDSYEEWNVYETYESALAAYESLVENGVYSASVCAVVQSTDYDPHPALLGVTQ